MEPLTQLWNTLGEQGVLDLIYELKGRLSFVQTLLEDATYKRTFLYISGKDRSRGGEQSFQFSRVLMTNQLDTVIRDFETEVRFLTHKIQYVSMGLSLAKRMQLRGIYDWGVFED